MSIILYGAASNTQSGWQYMIASLLFTIVIVGFILPQMYIKNIGLTKFVPYKIFVGKDVNVDISISNLSNKNKAFYDITETPILTELDPFSYIGRFNIIAMIVRVLHRILGEKDYTIHFFLKCLPVNKTVEHTHSFIPSKRGIHATGNLVISTSFPLGVFSFQKEYNPREQVVVYPKILDIRGGWINRIAHKSVASVLSYSYMPTSIPGTTRSLREYVPGDSPRHIHWPTSARLNKLLVREFEIESSGFVFIILDASDNYESEEYFELAVSSVASLLNACHIEGLVTMFATQDDAYDYFTDVKNDDWESQLEILARVMPVSSKPVCSIIDQLHQDVLAENPKCSPTYILVSSTYEADVSANRSNIVSVTISPKVQPASEYSITSEADLKYI